MRIDMIPKEGLPNKWKKKRLFLNGELFGKMKLVKRSPLDATAKNKEDLLDKMRRTLPLRTSGGGIAKICACNSKSTMFISSSSFFRG